MSPVSASGSWSVRRIRRSAFCLAITPLRTPYRPPSSSLTPGHRALHCHRLPSSRAIGFLVRTRPLRLRWTARGARAAAQRPPRPHTQRGILVYAPTIADFADFEANMNARLWRRRAGSSGSCRRRWGERFRALRPRGASHSRDAPRPGAFSACVLTAHPMQEWLIAARQRPAGGRRHQVVERAGDARPRRTLAVVERPGEVQGVRPPRPMGRLLPRRRPRRSGRSGRCLRRLCRAAPAKTSRDARARQGGHGR
jgi:hypothetical protein